MQVSKYGKRGRKRYDERRAAPLIFKTLCGISKLQYFLTKVTSFESAEPTESD